MTNILFSGIDKENGFNEEQSACLNESIKTQSAITFIASDFTNTVKSKDVSNKMVTFFEKIGVNFKCVNLIDVNISIKEAHEILKTSDIVFLMGGDPYLQMEGINKYGLKEYIKKRSIWAIGGDGWAYDIGFSGIDQILSSNENINILVLDTEVYSNTGGQSSKSTKLGAVAKFATNGKSTKKKDLFKIATNYPNVYVASTCLEANPMHTIKTMIEAEKHNGPSIIIGYSPCIEHGIKGGLTNSIDESKLSVLCGYNILMRYVNNKLTIDSGEPNFDKYDEFLSHEVRFNSLKKKNPELSTQILNEQKNNAIERYEYFKKLI